MDDFHLILILLFAIPSAWSHAEHSSNSSPLSPSTAHPLATRCGSSSSAVFCFPFLTMYCTPLMARLVATTTSGWCQPASAPCHRYHRKERTRINERINERIKWGNAINSAGAGFRNKRRERERQTARERGRFKRERCRFEREEKYLKK